MKPWSQRVKTALRDQYVAAGISQIAVSWMQEHLDENYGRGKGGERVSHAPLKNLRGSYESRSKPKGATVMGTRSVIVTDKNGKPRKVTLYRVEQSGYRNGGQPLRNTGALYRSLSAEGSPMANGIRLNMRGYKYGLYQDRGFKTRGPNYIPLTKKGKRGHGTGQNPKVEGLTRGKDYLMAWKGVTVPARPFILPTRDDLKMMGKSIYMSLKVLLKGK